MFVSDGLIRSRCAASAASIAETKDSLVEVMSTQNFFTPLGTVALNLRQMVLSLC